MLWGSPRKLYSHTDTIDFERPASTGDSAAMKSQTVLSDKALIVTACAGSRNAFGELVRRHSSLVFGTSLKMFRNREEQRTIYKTPSAKRVARFSNLKEIRSSRPGCCALQSTKR
jgi:hypothetical protein